MLLPFALALSVAIAPGCGAQEEVRVAKPTETPQTGLEPDASPRWEILAGRPEGAPTLPSAMAAWKDRIYLVHGRTISEFEPKQATWRDLPTRLPAPVGSGLALSFDDTGKLHILRGGRRRDFWRYDVEKGTLEILGAAPKTVGVGGALAFDGDDDRIFALRGGRSRDFWRYDLATGKWNALTRVGDRTVLCQIGQSSGLLMYSRGIVHAWPDHHIQRYEIATGRWLDEGNMSYGVRPWWDGQMIAKSLDADAWFVLQGMNSRTISLFDPNSKTFSFLRPRLPVRLCGEGSRAAIARVDGVKYLFVYAVAQGNRMLRIKVRDLHPIDLESPASDEGSQWITFHEKDGSSLVRRPALKPIYGIMGRAGAGWFFGRLRNLRLLDPATNAWTPYPGVDVGTAFGDGVCAVHDGEHHVYGMSGGGTAFWRVAVPALEAEKLPSSETATGVGAAMTALDGRIHVAFGGETRHYGVFDPTTNTWRTGPDLPAEATPVGRTGSALLVAQERPLLLTGTQAWKLGGDGAWTKVGDLPFALDLDGGMATVDPAGGPLVLVRGGGSREIASFDLATGATRTESLPDVVSVPGSRIVLDVVRGRRVLAIHRGHDSHEIIVRDLGPVEGAGR